MIEFVPDPNSPYLMDECKMRGNAERVYLPETEEELAGLMREASASATPVTVSGFRTGLCGGSVPMGGYLVSMERFSSLLGIGREDGRYFIRTQPCVTVNHIVRTVQMKRLEGLSDITDGACSDLLRDPSQYSYPVDPTEMDGSIGGNIAANASGARTFKYGPTRDWVRSLRLMLADGRTVRITRGEHTAVGRRFDCDVDGVRFAFDIPGYDFNTSVKNAAGLYSKEGMDLIDLVIGSEGILGIIVEADLWLTEWHPLISNIVFMPDDGSSLALIDSIRHDPVIRPEFLEYFDTGSVELIRRTCRTDPTILRPIDGGGSAVFMDLALDDDVETKYERIFRLIRDNGGDPSMSWVSYDQYDRKRMFAFRHSVPKAIFDYVATLKDCIPAINKMGTDMSVPEEHNLTMMGYYDRILRESGLEYVVFGHMGNCHPHIEIILKDMEDLRKAKECYDVLALRAFELGGSPSAEHGIGKLKRGYIGMMYGEEGIRQIRDVKRAFDPKLILNRGNMVE